MIIACIDVETSTGGDSPDPKVDEICEMGIVVADWDTKTVLTQYGQLYKVKKWSASSAKIHGIPESVCQEQGVDYDEIANIPNFIDFNSIDYAVAHNAPYDYTVLSRYIKEAKDLKWVCSQRDFNHGKYLKRRVTSKRLGHLAVDYGIPLINYHRAVDDCMTLLQLCFKHDVVEAYEKSIKPKIEIHVAGPFDEEIPPILRQAGYNWDAKAKQWYATIAEDEKADHEDLLDKLSYSIVKQRPVERKY